MKFNIILFILSFSFLSSCSTETSDPVCKKFHLGEFKYTEKPFGDFLVTRTKDKQIEYNEKGRIKAEFGIRWINDCTYELKLNKILDNPRNLSLPQDLYDMVKTCKITEIKEGTYTEETTTNLNDTINKTAYEKIN